jgi:hypothetical protein
MVAIRYASPVQRATGGNAIYQSGGYWVHRFDGNGTFTFDS